MIKVVGPAEILPTSLPVYVRDVGPPDIPLSPYLSMSKMLDLRIASILYMSVTLTTLPPLDSHRVTAVENVTLDSDSQ